MCLKILRYNIITSPFSRTGSVNIDKWCNGWTIKNTGNTNLEVFGEVLAPQASKAISGNYGEIFEGKVDLFFSVPTPAPAVPNNYCIFTQKVYVNAHT